jgi:hypothetical protein
LLVKSQGSIISPGISWLNAPFFLPKKIPIPRFQRQVNQELGEIGGVFVSKQPSDTDMGAKEPKTVLLKGIFYGKVRGSWGYLLVVKMVFHGFLFVMGFHS